jgi:meso-butanediol dehydrogenase/(S,S)-butanediol dehydrogenase/diacetyl reductase
MGDRLRGKVAIVTGAGSGIGRACALRFGVEGARVVVSDVRAEAAAGVAKEIEAAGGSARAATTDVSDPRQVDELVAGAKAAFGRLDVMVNNAAAPTGALVAETTDEVWRRVQSVTLDGVFHGVRAALGVMVPQGAGSIINVSSGAGLGGEYALGAYGAAKAAVINLTQTAAVENTRHGVRVNAICPGPIATPPLLAWIDHVPGGRAAFEAQIPAKRIGRPEEIANVALFLASDEASYVSGAVFVADGGVAARTAAPRFD